MQFHKRFRHIETGGLTFKFLPIFRIAEFRAPFELKAFGWETYEIGDAVEIGVEWVDFVPVAAGGGFGGFAAVAGDGREEAVGVGVWGGGK